MARETITQVKRLLFSCRTVLFQILSHGLVSNEHPNVFERIATRVSPKREAWLGLCKSDRIALGYARSDIGAHRGLKVLFRALHRDPDFSITEPLFLPNVAIPKDTRCIFGLSIRANLVSPSETRRRSE